MESYLSGENATIGAFIDNWNNHFKAPAWTKGGDEILAISQRLKTGQAYLHH